MKWLKKLFKKRETKKISLNDLEYELNQKEIDQKKEIEDIIDRIQDIKEELIIKLDELKEAKIEEKNQQIISRVESNRDSYIHQTKMMLRTIEKPEKEIKEIEKFIEQTTNEIKEFVKRSSKSFQITKYLIGKELEEATRKIKEITEQLELLEDKNKELEKINELTTKISGIAEKTDKEKLLKIEILDIEKEKEELEQEKEGKKQDIYETEEGEEYKLYLQVKENIKLSEQDLDELRSKLINLFSPIQKALRKYAKMTIENRVVEEYEQNPYFALLEDEHLKILDILEEINKNMNKLNIDEDKMNKIKEAIENITKEKLEKIKFENIEIKENIKQNKERINEMIILDNLSKKMKEKEILEINLKQKEDLLKDKKELLEKIDLKEEKKDIEETYRENMKEKIIIS